MRHLQGLARGQVALKLDNLRAVLIKIINEDVDRVEGTLGSSAVLWS